MILFFDILSLQRANTSKFYYKSDIFQIILNAGLKLTEKNPHLTFAFQIKTDFISNAFWGSFITLLINILINYLKDSLILKFYFSKNVIENFTLSYFL